MGDDWIFDWMKGEEGSDFRPGPSMKPTISGNQELGPLGVENGQMMESYRKLRDDRDEWKRKYEEGSKTLDMMDEEVKRLREHLPHIAHNHTHPNKMASLT